MFDQLNLSATTTATIAWDMTPDLAFCTFSAKGLRKDLVNTNERVCYFFIDTYGDAPRLYLMERGTRYVNVLAEVTVPGQMLRDCILSQGGKSYSKDNFPIDSTLKEWLITEVIEPDNNPYLIPTIAEDNVKEDFGPPLPLQQTNEDLHNLVVLPSEPSFFNDDQIKQYLLQWNVYDSLLNTEGCFQNAFKNSGNPLTVIDQRTGLLWQQSGLDLCSLRKMTQQIEDLNREGLARFHDWRIPTVIEAMSLMTPVPNSKGLHLHPCFSKEFPFIFTATRRAPTGYWFTDYKQGKVYWSSGTVPGGFCRLCRSIG